MNCARVEKRRTADLATEQQTASRAEQDLTAEVDELERENRALRDQLANYRQSRRPAGAAMPADRPPEPVYDEARRVARLRGSDPNR